MKKGLLLINLGTPKSTALSDVRQYLKEFLSDPCVIELPSVLRYILLYGVILPFRTPRSAKMWEKIWQKEGSPLFVESQKLTQKLAQKKTDFEMITLAMRYGDPTLKSQLKNLATCDEVTIIPLFPHYAHATTGSILTYLMQSMIKGDLPANVKIVLDFYQHPAFIKATADHLKPFINQHEFLLLSYHGLPIKQLKRTGCTHSCNPSCQFPFHRWCYRAQCYQLSQQLSEQLLLTNTQYDTAFQSRFGKTKWTEPNLETMLYTLRQRGIKQLAVACPAFVADCLETLEEIGIRAKETWLQQGGETFTLIPALNDAESFTHALVDIAKDAEPLNVALQKINFML